MDKDAEERLVVNLEESSKENLKERSMANSEEKSMANSEERSKENSEENLEENLNKMQENSFDESREQIINENPEKNVEEKFGGRLDDTAWIMNEEMSFEFENNVDKSLSESDTMMSPTPARRRHYKKDSKYLGDIYTLNFTHGDIQGDDDIQDDVYDDDDDDDDYDDDDVLYEKDYSLNETSESRYQNNNLISLQVRRESRDLKVNSRQHRSLMLKRTQSLDYQVLDIDKESRTLNKETADLLETNLHKILARRIQEGQEVSYRTTKLLTKAYYNLLRDTRPTKSLQSNNRSKKSAKDDPKLNWETLKQTDLNQLGKIVSGYSTIVSSLNDELLAELQKKDTLSSEQDTMLESISDLTDSLL